MPAQIRAGVGKILNCVTLAMIVFVHIARSGGSKIHEIMLSHFGEQAIIFNGLVNIPRALECALDSSNRRWYLGGHVHFAQLCPFLESRQPSDILFSTTRDPVERAVSLYYLCLRSPTWQPTLAPIARERGFAPFYSAAVDAGMLGNNPQCRFLSGSPDWRETLAAFQRHYDLVGTYRFYDNFLKRLETLLRPQVPGVRIDGERINAAYHIDTGGHWKRRDAFETLVSPDIRRRIERDNDQDFALIEHIESLEDGVFVNAPLAPGVPIG